MKLKKTILGLTVVAVAGVNAWLANDVRLAKNELSLVNLENVADASEGNPELWMNSNGQLDFNNSESIKGEGPGYLPNGTYCSRIEYTDIFYYCDGKSNNACTPKTERHYSYGS